MHLIHDTLTPDEQLRVVEVQNKLLQLQQVLINTFPDREFLAQSIIHALMMGEHVLVYGDPGTAKTLMLRSVLNSIAGGIVFDTTLTAQTTPAHLLGGLILDDYKAGNVNYNLANSIVTAQYALLNEFNDAPPPTLRSLNDALNERRWMHGQKAYPVYLRSAFAATNVPPQANKDVRILAVMDRFLFRVKVSELVDETDQVSMLAASTNAGAYVLPQIITHEDIVFIQDIIRGRNLIHDIDIIVTYNSLVNQFEAATGTNITDRGRVKSLQALEASCLLRGQWTVDAEDLIHLGNLFCDNSDPKQVEAFQKLAASVIKAHREAKGKATDSVELVLIDQLTKSLPVIDSLMSPDDLIKAYRTMEDIKFQFDQIGPVILPDTNAKIVKLRAKIEKTDKQLFKALSAK